MEKMSKIKMILNLSGDNLPIDEVIEKVPLKPSRVSRIGELMDPRFSGTAKVNSWNYEISIPDSLEIEEHLQALFRVMQPKDLFIEFIRKWEGHISCVIYLGETTPCVFLGSHIIAELNSYGLSLDLDMYHT